MRSRRRVGEVKRSYYENPSYMAFTDGIIYCASDFDERKRIISKSMRPIHYKTSYFRDKDNLVLESVQDVKSVRKIAIPRQDIAPHSLLFDKKLNAVYRVFRVDNSVTKDGTRVSYLFLEGVKNYEFNTN